MGRQRGIVKIFDISLPLSENMLVYPGDIHPTFHQEDRGQYLISDLHLSTHTGTHIDAPLHFISKGKSIDKLSPEIFIGRVFVADFSGLEKIARVIYRFRIH